MSELSPLSLDDYDAIAAAVEETERGRWFLAEFARRNRNADTEQVLAAIAAIEQRLAAPEPARPQASNESAARLIEQAIAAAEALRAAPGVSSRELNDLQRTLDLALEAVGGAPAPAEPERRSAEPGPIEQPRLALAPPPAQDEVAWVDLDRFEAQIADDDDASEAIEDPVAETEEASPAEAEAPAFSEAPRFVNGWAHEAAELEPPAPRSRARLPAAHTPLLLDGLSEAERAILFA